MFDILQSKIPLDKRSYKRKDGVEFKLVGYDYDGEDNLDTSIAYFRDKNHPSFSEPEAIQFSELDSLFSKLSGKGLSKLIEEYDEEFEYSRITHIDNYDENEKPLTKADWEKMLENLDMPREKHESRPVVCNDGLLCYNAATACRCIGLDPKYGNRLYNAAEKHKKFKKQYWRYAERDELKAQIEAMDS